MAEPVSGRATSAHVFAGCTDLVVVAVTANAHSGSFNCPPERVTLNGAAAETPWRVAEFVATYRHTAARVIDPDYSQSGTGYVPAGSIELTAFE
jgi:hypothetical protein